MDWAILSLKWHQKHKQANRKHRYFGLHQNEKQLCLKAHGPESEKIPTELEKLFTDITYLKRDMHSEYINVLVTL